jgi:hypothetical protein
MAWHPALRLEIAAEFRALERAEYFSDAVQRIESARWRHAGARYRAKRKRWYDRHAKEIQEKEKARVLAKRADEAYHRRELEKWRKQQHRQSLLRWADKPPRVCPGCGVSFRPPHQEGHPQKYCTKPCRNAHYYRLAKERGTR